MLAEMGSIVEAVNVGKDSPRGVGLTRQDPLGRPLPLEAGVEGFSTGIIPWGPGWEKFCCVGRWAISDT